MNLPDFSTLPPPGRTDEGGVAAGYRPGRTLPLRVEWRRQLSRRRTQLVFGLMALIPLILVIALSFGDGPADVDNNAGVQESLADLAQVGSGNFAVLTMLLAGSFLMAIVVALFFGDALASDATWGSLRYLLAAPVPRVRLLRQKVVVAAALSLAALLTLAVSGAVIGGIAYGFSALTTPVGDQLGALDTVLRLGVVIAAMLVQLSWVAALAVLLSTLTDVPLGAVGGAVLISIVIEILDGIPELGAIRAWLPTRYASAWTGALNDPIRWDDMLRGAALSLGLALVMGALAMWRFRRKDITS